MARLSIINDRTYSATQRRPNWGIAVHSDGDAEVLTLELTSPRPGSQREATAARMQSPQEPCADDARRVMPWLHGRVTQLSECRQRAAGRTA
jgi:hypothetical protein